MSTKRILGITALGLALIVAVVGVMLLTSGVRREHDAVWLPDSPVASEDPEDTVPDTRDRVEVNRDTIQAVVSQTLSRPEVYSRDVIIESFWDGGQASYHINVSVNGGVTSIRATPHMGVEKRIIVTPDLLYIWYRGDAAPFVGSVDSAGDGIRTADEWQMLVTYEDILRLDPSAIIDAGYTVFEGEDSVYAVYRSPLFGYTRTYYISIELGLVIAAQEYDEAGNLVYSMTAGEAIVGEVNPAAFTLPDGTIVN